MIKKNKKHLKTKRNSHPKLDGIIVSPEGFTSLFLHSWFCSVVDPSDAFILGVERRSEVSLGLVRHAHPLQPELTAFNEISAHLIKEGEKKTQRHGSLKKGKTLMKIKLEGMSNNED